MNVAVAAIFHFGGTIDDTLSYTRLADAQGWIEQQSGQTMSIRLKVADVFQARRISYEVAYAIDHYVYIKDWTTTQGHVYNDIQLVRVVMFLVLIVVIAVASFNIVSTLVMAVNDKKVISRYYVRWARADHSSCSPLLYKAR